LRPIYFKAADGKDPQKYLDELWDAWKENSKGYEKYCDIYKDLIK
jgi:hypothetical protein